jgi:hypothetical protein
MPAVEIQRASVDAVRAPAWMSASRTAWLRQLSTVAADHPRVRSGLCAR